MHQHLCTMLPPRVALWVHKESRARLGPTVTPNKVNDSSVVIWNTFMTDIGMPVSRLAFAGS